MVDSAYFVESTPLAAFSVSLQYNIHIEDAHELNDATIASDKFTVF